MRLQGHSAVVAGGAGGFGSATVERLVSLGAAVVVLDPDAERSEALVARLGESVRAVKGGANDDEAVGSAIAQARTMGTFSIGVSATGVALDRARLLESDGSVMAKELLLANLDLHVVGPFNFARLAAAAFAENEPDEDGQRGVIVQTASIGAFDGQATMVPYSAAKGAVVAMTLPMARDLAPIGIRVCTIAPGGFFTPRFSTARIQDMLVEDVLFPKRLGQPHEYAQLVEAIIENVYLNGETIRLDGGTRLGPVMGWRST